MTITHKLTQHYAVTTPRRYLTTGNACKSRFIVIIQFPLTAPIVYDRSSDVCKYDVTDVNGPLIG